jgi:hypothetical protein
MGRLNPATPRPKSKILAAYRYIFPINAPSLSGLVKPVIFRSFSGLADGQTLKLNNKDTKIKDNRSDAEIYLTAKHANDAKISTEKLTC